MESTILGKRKQDARDQLEEEFETEDLSKELSDIPVDEQNFRCASEVIEIILYNLKSDDSKAKEKVNLAVGLLNINLPSKRQSNSRLLEYFGGEFVDLATREDTNEEVAKILIMFVNILSKKSPPSDNKYIGMSSIAPFTQGLVLNLIDGINDYSKIEKYILLAEIFKLMSYQDFTKSENFETLSQSGLLETLLPNFVFLFQRILSMNANAASYLFESFTLLLNSMTEEPGPVIHTSYFAKFSETLQNEKIISLCRDEQLILYSTCLINIINENPDFKFQNHSFEKALFSRTFDTIIQIVDLYAESFRQTADEEKPYCEQEYVILVKTVKRFFYALAKVAEGPFLSRATYFIDLNKIQRLCYGLFNLLCVNEKAVNNLVSSDNKSSVTSSYFKCNYLGYTALLNLIHCISGIGPLNTEIRIFVLEVSFNELQKHLLMNSMLVSTPKAEIHNKSIIEKLLKLLIFIKETMEENTDELVNSFARTINPDEMANIFDFITKDVGAYSNDVFLETTDILASSIHIAKARVLNAELFEIVTKVI
jgi:hypothetical protein